MLPGIVVAVALSIGNVFRRAWWPYQAILGRVPGISGYHDMRSYPHAERLPGCVIFRFDAPLFFANTRTFREQIRPLAGPNHVRNGSSSRPSRSPTSTPPPPTCSTSSTWSSTRAASSLVFAEMKDPVRRKIDRYELTETIDPAHFFPTLEAALEAFRNETGASWGAATPDPPS